MGRYREREKEYMVVGGRENVQGNMPSITE